MVMFIIATATVRIIFDLKVLILFHSKEFSWWCINTTKCRINTSIGSLSGLSQKSAALKRHYLLERFKTQCSLVYVDESKANG